MLNVGRDSENHPIARPDTVPTFARFPQEILRWNGPSGSPSLAAGPAHAPQQFHHSFIQILLERSPLTSSLNSLLFQLFLSAQTGFSSLTLTLLFAGQALFGQCRKWDWPEKPELSSSVILKGP